MLKLNILNSILSQIGINISKVKNIIYIYKYFKDYLKFSEKSTIDFIAPILGQHNEKSSVVTKHYFNQDLLVASYIFKKKPKRHVDIGSRIDGFVAQVASFRRIEVFDIRDNSFQHKNIIFKKKDITKIDKSFKNYCDSLSCLHTLEHFGLGRYGDQIDPIGYLKGFKNLIELLKTNGRLYVSFPISNKNITYFNSERSFQPKEILKWSDKLRLIRFDFIDDNDQIFLDVNLYKFNKRIKYGCGIYTFKKK